MRDPRAPHVVDQPQIAPDAGMAMPPGVGHAENPYAREGRPLGLDGPGALAAPGAVRADHAGFDRTVEHPTASSNGPDPVERLTSDPRSRSWLMLATAILSALTLLLLLVHVLTDSGDGADVQPVLVEGVSCLVGEGPDGAEGQSVLYCQR